MTIKEKTPLLQGVSFLLMAPGVGFEPTTDRLTADCSTTELPGIVLSPYGPKYNITGILGLLGSWKFIIIFKFLPLGFNGGLLRLRLAMTVWMSSNDSLQSKTPSPKA